MKTPARTHKDLEARVEARKRELIEEILEHKMSVRLGAAETVTRLKERLSDLAQIVRTSVVDGWSNVGPTAKHDLEQWILR